MIQNSVIILSRLKRGYDLVRPICIWFENFWISRPYSSLEASIFAKKSCKHILKVTVSRDIEKSITSLTTTATQTRRTPNNRHNGYFLAVICKINSSVKWTRQLIFRIFFCNWTLYLEQVFRPIGVLNRFTMQLRHSKVTYITILY